MGLHRSVQLDHNATISGGHATYDQRQRSKKKSASVTAVFVYGS